MEKMYIDEPEIMESMKPQLNIYKNFGSETEDVDALLNRLVTAENVPNDIFENLRLLSVTRYYAPQCVFSGTITVRYSYEQTKGEKVYKTTDVANMPAMLKIPCHVGGALPAEIEQRDEFLTSFNLDGTDEQTLLSNAQGWTVEFPEGIDGEAVIDQYSEQMDKLLHDYAINKLKNDLGSVDKLKLLDLSFTQMAGGIMDFVTLCRQPYSIIEYEYKGQSFKALYQQGEFRDFGLPVDDSTKKQNDRLTRHIGECAVGIVVMLILQFVLIHFWPVTLVVIAALLVLLFKFRKEQNTMNESASDERSTQKANYTAEKYLSALSHKQVY